MKQLINEAFSRFGYRVVQDSPLLFHGQDLNHLYREAPWIKYWLELDQQQRQEVSPFLWEAKAQLGQDLFAIIASSNKKNDRPGYFVDIGASDGIRYSNSWLLEKNLGWDGIAAEPARSWHERLTSNRSCIIEKRAIFASSGEILEFLDVSNKIGYPELSSLSFSKSRDERSSLRTGDASSYTVETVSLTDLLKQHDAPSNIDFLSIDTEGSEYEIMKSVDFNNYRFASICIEHNYNKLLRNSIHALLQGHGYRRVHEAASAWDDWYIDSTDTKAG